MRHIIPPELDALLSARDDIARVAAWERFVEGHSRLLLHVARSAGGSHDDVMDRYAYLLQKLSADDYRRLRSWVTDRRSKMTTWMVVVAKRLSLDQHRERYGRPRSDGEGAARNRSTRRQLADLVADELLDHTVEQSDESAIAHPERELRHAELAAALDECVGSLEPSDRLLLALRFRDDRTAADIARVMCMSSQFQVYRRIDAVLGQLRDALRTRGVEDSVP